MRTSGVYTTYAGEERQVIGRTDGDTLTVVLDRLDGRRVTEEVPVERVGTVVKVVTTADWRGGKVILAMEVEPGVYGFDTSDSQLAQRELLSGDPYSGWSGAANTEDLEHVQERITVVREGGQP